jgi:chaperonin GroEL (HSP60 family)
LIDLQLEIDHQKKERRMINKDCYSYMPKAFFQETTDRITTATVLAEVIFNKAMRNIVSGANPVTLKKGIDQAVEARVKALEQSANLVKSKQEANQITIISTNNNDDIGRIISEAMEMVINDSIITVSVVAYD